jgi:hypothetical protein
MKWLHPRDVQRIRITASHHPLCGQSLRVIRHIQGAAEHQFVVELPNGHTQLVPIRWTEAAPTPMLSADDPVRFSPGSLRALVRMVAHLQTRQQPEATDDRDPNPRALDHFQPLAAPTNGVPVDRTAASPASGPAVAR